MCHPSASSADPVMHHFSTSLDHVGFFARSVEDVGILLDAHAGHDPDDPGSRASASVPLPSQAASSALDLRIGVVRSVATAAEKDVRDRFEESLSHLEELGADLIDVEPFEGIELKKPVVNPEFAAAHGERFRQSPDLFGEKARRYLELGLETDETVYIEGPEQRKALQRTVEWRIQGIDAIVCPTSLTTAKPIGEDTRAKEDANITIPFNIPPHRCRQRTRRDRSQHHPCASACNRPPSDLTPWDLKGATVPRTAVKALGEIALRVNSHAKLLRGHLRARTNR